MVRAVRDMGKAIERDEERRKKKQKSKEKEKDGITVPSSRQAGPFIRKTAP